MTVRNNDVLFNAAQVGFVAGGYTFTFPVGLTSAEAAPNVAAAEVFATALDAAIANDATISQGSGAPIAAPTGAQIAESQAKSALVQALSQAVFASRTGVDLVPGDYAGIVASLVVVYTAVVANFQFT